MNLYAHVCAHVCEHVCTHVYSHAYARVHAQVLGLDDDAATSYRAAYAHALVLCTHARVHDTDARVRVHAYARSSVLVCVHARVLAQRSAFADGDLRAPKHGSGGRAVETVASKLRACRIRIA